MSKKDFKPPKMYKNGKTVMANTYQEHLSLGRKGYDHSAVPFKMVPETPLFGKISGPCKAAAKRKFDVWPSAYASGWGVRCTKAGGPSKMGKSKKKK